MDILRVYESSINDRVIEQAVEALRAGRTIVYPTDTCYAIGCNALDNNAVERLCRQRGIDSRRNMLSVVCDGLSMASEYARIDNAAFKVIRPRIPGPFTFVLPASTRLPKVFKGRKEVGIRVPANAIARRLAEALGNPLLSATASEAPEPDEVATELESSGAALMVDGGACPGVQSTVVDVATGEVLRQGAGEFD